MLKYLPIPTEICTEKSYLHWLPEFGMLCFNAFTMFSYFYLFFLNFYQKYFKCHDICANKDIIINIAHRCYWVCKIEPIEHEMCPALKLDQISL